MKKTTIATAIATAIQSTAMAEFPKISVNGRPLEGTFVSTIQTPENGCVNNVKTFQIIGGVRNYTIQVENLGSMIGNIAGDHWVAPPFFTEISTHNGANTVGSEQNVTMFSVINDAGINVNSYIYLKQSCDSKQVVTPTNFRITLKSIPAKAIVTIKVKKPDTASTGVPIPGVNVTLFDTDFVQLGSQETNAQGIVTFNLPLGVYNIRYVGNTGSEIWHGNKPKQSASVYSIRSLTNPLSITTTMEDTKPIISAITRLNTQYTINGINFGSEYGKLWFNGQLVTSGITLWNNTQVIFTAPTSAISGCLKVFAKYSGFSNCGNYPIP